MFGSLISAGSNLIGSLFGYDSNEKSRKQAKEIAEKNLAFQREQFEYSKALQNQIFDREDNAIQRRKADLINAGINPLLAAGSGAGAGSVVPTQAPQMDSSFLEYNARAGASLQSGMQNVGADISQASQRILNQKHTGAQIDLIKSQIENNATQNDKMRAEINNFNEVNKNLKLDGELKTLDKEIKQSSIDIQNGLKKFALDAGYPPELIQKADPSTLLMFYSGYQLSQDLENIAVPLAQVVSRFPYLKNMPIEKTANLLYNGLRFFAGASGQVVPKSKIYFAKIKGILQKIYKYNEKK